MKKVLLTLLLLPTLAHAYIDPGTGSYLLQLLAAGALGSLYAIKTYWAYIKSLLFKSKSKDEK